MILHLAMYMHRRESMIMVHEITIYHSNPLISDQHIFNIHGSSNMYNESCWSYIATVYLFQTISNSFLSVHHQQLWQWHFQTVQKWCHDPIRSVECQHDVLNTNNLPLIVWGNPILRKTQEITIWEGEEPQHQQQQQQPIEN